MAISVGVARVLAAKFMVMLPHLDERQRRLYLGSEARALGHGGIAAVARAAGVSELTVSAGVAELDAGAEPLGRAWPASCPGGGTGAGRTRCCGYCTSRGTALRATR
jgi:hypothetical protein